MLTCHKSFLLSVLLATFLFAPLHVLAASDVQFMQPDKLEVKPYAPSDIPKYTELAERKENPDAEALYVLGYMYYYGRGVPEDKLKGQAYVERAAEAGNADAMYLLVRIYEAASNNTLALDWLFKAAKARNPNAWFLLGEYYETGNGVFADIDKARKWYEAAYEAGILNAKVKLAFMYRDGRGVKKDMKRAIQLVEEFEPLVDKDTQFSIWLLLADMYTEQANGQYDENIIKWQTKAAEAGHAPAQFTLAEAYLNGTGVKQDYTQAIYWYEKSAAGGNTIAMTRLGYIHANGNGVPVDYKKAVDWYTRAADGGSSEAAWNLGNLYMGGHGVGKDVEEANKWFGRAEFLRVREDRARNRSSYGF